MIKNVNKKNSKEERKRERERRRRGRMIVGGAVIGLAKEGGHMVGISTMRVRSRNRTKQRGGAKNGNGRRMGGGVQCVA